MAKPERITSITVPDIVMYDETAVIYWTESAEAHNYRLYVKADNLREYKLIYSGAASRFVFDAAKYTDYGKVRFRVYAENSDGVSLMPCESTEMVIVDVEIREYINGDVMVFPFNMSVDMRSSKFGEIPSLRETSTQITGLDGEIPNDTKYSYRLFDLALFMKNEFKSVAEREEYIRKMAAHIDRSVRRIRYLLYRGKIFGVKAASAPDFRRRPAYCGLDISFKCYEVYGYGTEEKAIHGDGICVLEGDREVYPVITLEGKKNNPVINVNGIEYKIAIDTNDGDIITIDCEKETVFLEAADGSQKYLAGAFYLDFPIFHIGENTVEGCACVRWRDKYFVM
ncbi:MAG: hypothetical protein ACI4YB_01940 [Oscillospiraceae bacterium]